MQGLKRLVFGGALAAALAVPMLTPAPAQAWWGHPAWYPRWGWHGGWHAGVVIGAPVVITPPVVVAAPGPVWHFVPGHVAPNGVWVPPHWGYY